MLQWDEITYLQSSGPLQVLLRASSFVLNGFILRFIQAELLGVVNLRCVRHTITMLLQPNVVSEPDPRKNQKESLGDRLGWQCTERNIWNL